MTLPDDVRALFEGANFVALATLLPDGAPVSIPIWAGIEDGRIIFFTQAQSRKATQLERDPRVGLAARQRGRRRSPKRLAVIDDLARGPRGRAGTMHETFSDGSPAETAGIDARHEGTALAAPADTTTDAPAMITASAIVGR